MLFFIQWLLRKNNNKNLNKYLNFVFCLEINDYKVEVENLKNEQESLESENLELKSEVDSYKEKVKEFEEKLASAEKNLENVRQTSQKSTEIEKGTHIFYLYLFQRSFLYMFLFDRNIWVKEVSW